VKPGAVGLLVLLAACGGAANPALRDADGVAHQPLARGPGTVHVVVFTSHECPIANAYAPTLKALAASWAGKPVRLFLAHVDPDVAADQVRAHAAAYELPGTVLLDPRHELARALGATRTPEAVVLGDAGIAYRGRIDDQWAALGSRAQQAAVHDLRDAVAAVLAGKAVANPTTDVVGCLLPEPKH